MDTYRHTVVGSYPRPAAIEEIFRCRELLPDEVDDLIRWAVREQVDLGLESITDGEGYRENLYHFYQKRLEGLSMEKMVRQSFGAVGLGMECARVVGAIRNPRFGIAHKWRVAREAAPPECEVKLTVTGPHVLTRFSRNERLDLYPDDLSLCQAYAAVLTEELKEAVAAGCEHIQFDEPMWTESPQHSEWAADVLNQMIGQLPAVRISLHVCGGTRPGRRVYFTPYSELAPAFRKVHIDEVLLEHCTLSYDMMELWRRWDFRGDLALGVVDQRSDQIETPERIRQRLEAALAFFPPERLVLTSECGFGQVPLATTRAKLRVLVATSRELRMAAAW